MTGAHSLGARDEASRFTMSYGMEAYVRTTNDERSLARLLFYKGLKTW